MFDGTSAKLEDAQTSLRQLRAAGDAQSTRLAFTSFLSNARAVTYALQKEAADEEGFLPWYVPRQEEMRNDELMRFIHEARIEDFHQAKRRIKFQIDVECIEAFHVNIPDDEVFASYHCEFDNREGAFVVLDPGTPRERRLPTEVSGKFGPLRAEIANPPQSHLGQRVESAEPAVICKLAMEYLERLVYDAKVKFAS